MFYLLYLVAVASALAANIYDITLTERGLAAKVGVEANDELVGSHPTVVALYLRDLAFLLPFVVLPLVSHLLGNEGLAYGSLAGPVVATIKHVHGARAWAQLLSKKK